MYTTTIQTEWQLRTYSVTVYLQSSLSEKLGPFKLLEFSPSIKIGPTLSIIVTVTDQSLYYSWSQILYSISLSWYWLTRTKSKTTYKWKEIPFFLFFSSSRFTQFTAEHDLTILLLLSDSVFSFFLQKYACFLLIHLLSVYKGTGNDGKVRVFCPW